jgi:hypothetical protein
MSSKYRQSFDESVGKTAYTSLAGTLLSEKKGILKRWNTVRLSSSSSIVIM